MACLVTCLLLVTATIAGAAAAPGGTVDSVSFSKDSTITVTSGVVYVAGWESQTVTVSYDSSGSADLCAYAGGAEGTELTCTQVAATTSPSTTSLTIDWPDNTTGKQQFTVALVNDSGVVDSHERTVHVLPSGGDYDDDGLSNRAELESGTQPLEPDTDGDGLADGEEVNVLETSPTDSDTDGDGLPDGKEVNKYDTNPTNGDSDGDGLSDGPEVVKYNTDPAEQDTDGDGLTDGAEVDGATDPTNPDSDDDGLSDGKEVNQYDTNSTIADTDEDGLTDGEEVNKYNTDPTKPDTDEDGLTDGEEVNKYNTDPTKPDTDGDGMNDSAEIAAGSNPGTAKSTNTIFGVDASVVVLGGLALLIGGGAIVGRWYLGRPEADTADDTQPPADAETGGPSADPSNGNGRGPGPTGSPEPVSGPDSEPVDPDYLTDEDRVLQLLDQNDGRLKQSDFVSETDWSKSKVSRVLSKMASSGEIRKVALGRENLIIHPDVESEASHSLFENRDDE
ncbi:helix-turn-helix transcriptional regulator [Haloarchaeobius amylolyticus]|uniref:helix-turn-helix transcriptional regulator n=1 Tax=Haloarchaeobius amylolyticus TaxID=1198296 RepID=UPI00226E0B2F